MVMSVEFMRDEIDKKKEELIARGKAQTTVFLPTVVKEKKEGYYYRGVNANKRRVATFESKGYETVNEKDQESWTIEHKKDGAKQYGDQVLMRITLDKYVENRAVAELNYERQRGETIAATRERLNKLARDGGLIREHSKDITFDDSHEGAPFVVQQRRPNYTK